MTEGHRRSWPPHILVMTRSFDLSGTKYVHIYSWVKALLLRDLATGGVAGYERWGRDSGSL